jgi:hypothetical protein
VYLGVGGNTFWIVTPGALETAAFKKYRRSDTGTIFGGHPLYFQDSGLKCLQIDFCHICLPPAALET